MARASQVENRTRHGSPALLAVGVLAAICQSNFIIDWVLRGGSGMDVIISSLAADGEPNALLLRALDVACAVLVIVLVPFVRAALPSSGWRTLATAGLVTFAVGAIAAAAIHTCAPGATCTGVAAVEALWHDIASLVSEAGIIASLVGCWVLTRRNGPLWLHRWAGIVIAVVAAVGIASGAVLIATGTATTPPSAYLQRVQVLATSSWFLALGLLASHGPQPRHPAQSHH